MAAHTYRGSTIRTMLGLEDERQAFMRYKRFEGRNVITSDAQRDEYSSSWLHLPLCVDTT
jgi:hypothetical protein